ncbi:MAG: hypothetical protein U0452_01420 [Anaerolineae bacterium]
MEGVSLQEIFKLLGPQTGNMLWNILLYAVFFLSITAILTMPDKNMVPSLLMGAVALAAVIAKLSTSAIPPLFPKREFGMFLINVMIFVFPLLTAGIIRARKKGRSVMLCVITGVLGGMYFFFFWFLEQAN